jgi:hypothetical protein
MHMILIDIFCPVCNQIKAKVKDYSIGDIQHLLPNNQTYPMLICSNCEERILNSLKKHIEKTNDL